MGKERKAGRQGGGKRPSAERPGGRADGRVKLSVYVSEDLRRRLNHLAIDEAKDIGRLIEPKCWELIGKRYEQHRPADRPEPPAAAPPPVRLAAVAGPDLGAEPDDADGGGGGAGEAA